MREHHRGLPDRSTVYTYTLLKKIDNRLPFIVGYAALILPVVAYNLLFFRVQGLVLLLIGMAVVLPLHAVLIGMYIRFATENRAANWTMSRQFPYMGPMPVGFMPASLFLRVHFHVLGTGVAFLSAGYVWIPRVLYWNLLFLHVWLLLPKLAVAIRLLRLNKAGILRYSDNQIFYYLP